MVEEIMIKVIAIIFILVIMGVSVLLIRTNNKAVVNTCEITSGIRKCPENLGNLFLPRTFSARSIYVGYSKDQIHVEFLETLIDIVSKLEVVPKVNILIPHLQDYEAHQTLKKYFFSSTYSFINIIPTSSKDTVWAQDYLEILFNTKTGVSKIVDLPYHEREGEDLPMSVALVCQKELIPQAQFTGDYRPGNGDYGGNIEPITSRILSVGSNLSDETYKVLQSLTSQEMVDLNVDWLETGHVDELITTLPYKKNAGACEQALLIASPQLALNIIASASIDLPEEKNPNPPVFADIKRIDLYHCLYPKNKNRTECLELAKANITYQSLIDSGVKDLQNLIQKHHGCRLTEEKFPQLFVPIKKQDQYGTFKDQAISLNSNSVNNIFFFPSLLLAKQPFIPFQKKVDDVLSKFPYDVIYIDDKFAHELNGGIHCATNISYGCAP
jgi:hypothetical protein